MAIKIDLLPRYVALQRRFNLLWKVAAVFLLGTVVILALIHARGQTDLNNLRAELAVQDREAKYTEEANKATSAAVAAAAPLETFSVFMVNASRTGAERANLINLLARYVAPGSVVNSIDITDGTKVVITATIRNPDDYARFLLGLRSGSASRGGAVFSADPRTSSVVPLDPVVGNRPSGYGSNPVRPLPSGQPQIVAYPIKMTVEGLLKSPVVVPVEPGSAAASGTPGAQGAPTPSPTPTPNSR